MNNCKYDIWIEAEHWEDGWDINNANSDVIVSFDNNERWIASFFTYSNIQKLTKKNQKTGECLNGKYFWSSDMLLIDEVSRENIEKLIEHLISEDEFKTVFRICKD